MEDRNRIRTSITAVEGTDFDFTDKINYAITQMLMDSIPEKSVVLAFAPGGGEVVAVQVMFLRSVWG